MASDERQLPRLEWTARNIEFAAFVHGIGKSNAATISFNDGKTNFYFPAFKFLSSIHAQSMLDDGEVYLPPLTSFRDANLHGGLIHDAGEGRLTIINQYTGFAGLAKNANGLLPLSLHSPYELLCLSSFQCQNTLEVIGIYAYCMTQHFLSDSLAWALAERGKEACVLITRVDKFCTVVTEAFADLGFAFVDVNGCLYVSDDLRRIFEIDPSGSSITNRLLTYEHLTALVKPQRYEAQRELRALWARKSPPLDPVKKQIPQIEKLCLPVHFSRLKREWLISKRSPPPAVTATINDKSGKVAFKCVASQPQELFLPVVYGNDENELMLGFWNRNALETTVDTANINFPSAIGLCSSAIGWVMGNIPLCNVGSIEFSHE